MKKIIFLFLLQTAPLIAMQLTFTNDTDSSVWITKERKFITKLPLNSHKTATTKHPTPYIHSFKFSVQIYSHGTQKTLPITEYKDGDWFIIKENNRQFIIERVKNDTYTVITSIDK